MSYIFIRAVFSSGRILISSFKKIKNSCFFANNLLTFIKRCYKLPKVEPIKEKKCLTFLFISQILSLRGLGIFLIHNFT